MLRLASKYPNIVEVIALFIIFILGKFTYFAFLSFIIEHIALHDVFYNVSVYFRYYYFIPSSIFCVGIFILPFVTLFAHEHGYKRVLIYILSANVLGCLILYLYVSYITLLISVLLLSFSLSLIAVICLKIWQILPRKWASFSVIFSVCIYFLLMSLAIKFYYLIQEKDLVSGRLLLGVIFSSVGLIVVCFFIKGQANRFNILSYQEKIYIGFFQAIKHYKYFFNIFGLIFFVIGFRMLMDKYILPDATLKFGILSENYISFIILVQMLLAIIWSWLGVFYLKHKYLLLVSIILVIFSNISMLVYCRNYTDGYLEWGYILFTIDRIISFATSTYIVGYCLSSILFYFRKSKAQAFIVGLFSTLANVTVWVVLQLMLI